MPETEWRAAPGLDRRLVLLVLVAGLALRLALVAYYTPRQSWSGDPQYYLAEGRQLAATGHHGGDPNADHLPGMAALVALGCAFGEGGCRYLPLILFALCATASAAGLWWLLLPGLRPAARLPALVVMQFGMLELLMTVFRLLPDLPALSLTVATIVALVAAARAGSPAQLGLAALAGLAGGATLYLRPDYGPVLGALAAVWWLSARRRLGGARAGVAMLVMAATIALALLPWGLRNAHQYGRFQIFPDTGSRALYWAFNDARQLDWFKPPNPRIDDAPPDERGELARAAALRWMAEHPLDTLFLLASRAASHLAPAAPGPVRSAANQIEPRPLRWLYRGAIEVVNEVWIVLGVLALAASGMTLPLALRLLAAFALIRVIFPGLLYPDQGRYALIVVPFLACVAVWYFGGPRPPSPRELPRRVWLALAALILIQTAYLWRWGWTR